MKKPYFVALVIVILAFGLRVFHLNQLYVFGADEEYQINIATTLVKHLHPIWIGVSAANTGFYLGPFWSYFTYIWLLLSHGEILLTAYIAVFIGTLTTLAIFYIGWKMFSLRVGIVSSLLYACLPLVVFFDQKYWNPSATPLLSITLIYSLYKVKSNQKFWWLFAFVYALVFHTHLSLAPFLLLAFYNARSGIRKNILIQSVGIFILVISPLIVFDYFHNLSNIATPLRLSQLVSMPHPSILEKISALFTSIARLWYLSPFSINANEILAVCSKYRSLPSLLALPFMLLILKFFFQKQTYFKENTKILSLGILLISLSYILFPGRVDEYYLLGLFPILLFIPALVWHKYLSPILISLICFLVIISVVTASNPYGLASKKQIISQVMSKVGNSPYELIEDGQCHKYEGWRYLFATYGRKPEKSSIDSSFGWLYPQEIHSIPVKYSVIITGKDTGILGFSYQIISH